VINTKIVLQNKLFLEWSSATRGTMQWQTARQGIYLQTQAYPQPEHASDTQNVNQQSLLPQQSYHAKPQV
jgi:hypothetical protein